MENYKLILPEHLNQFGYLFGGHLLAWVDEVAWITATLDFPERRFVTIGMDKVEFRKPIREGAILRFLVEKVKLGNTSVQYVVTVFNKTSRSGDTEKVFSTNVTFVCLDEEGNKRSIVNP